MSFLKTRTSIAINVLIIIMGVIGGGLFLLFGVANLINPEVPETYLTQNMITSLMACVIGLGFLILAIATLRGLLPENSMLH